MLHTAISAREWPPTMPNLEMNSPNFSLLDMFNYLELLVMQDFQGSEAELEVMKFVFGKEFFLKK
ncbi:hypothetical protein F0562_018955 [Nyssa sinensis]|uniref:Uncharacterized protein n=1 Tax=Nyssa sinensis TaxID=561372 RepID=A0A5J4ZCF0_9ASTE|nr:hypothetical protein F0562_018955 [Nyssa sinensis]